MSDRSFTSLRTLTTRVRRQHPTPDRPHADQPTAAHAADRQAEGRESLVDSAV